MTTGAYSPERMAARAEIQDVMYRWCRSVDRCDWETVRRDIFHPDGTDDHGIYRGDVEGLIAWLSKRHETISRSMHLMGNMLIEFADDDTAVAETYCIAIQRYTPEGDTIQGAATRAAITGGASTGDGAFDMMMTGRYVDLFTRRDGRWKVQRRTVVFDNSTMFPVPPGAPQLSADWAVSTRDTSDPLWALRRAAGL